MFKKSSFLLLGGLITGGLMAQEARMSNFPQERTMQSRDAEVIASQRATGGIVNINPQLTETAIVWSEDFSSGIPAGWSNQGLDSLGAVVPGGNWEYRGPNTTPSNTVGTRGAFGNGVPIASPTTANGFVIFDSDFLDNNGVSGGFGSGISPSPHVGNLTTDTIDLSGSNDVVLEFHQYYRKFGGPGGDQALTATYVEFSTDGGTTFGNRIALNTSLSTNENTPNSTFVQLDVSNIIGGQSQAKVRFIFDGDYYEWMLDDIAIREKPEHQLTFTTWRGAPAHDVIYRDQTNSNGKYGHITVKQCRDIFFDANIFNFGASNQTGVALEIEVLDAANNVVFTTTTPTANVNSTDSVGFDVLTTTVPWNACTQGEFRVVYKGISDSIPSAAGSFMPVDTFVVRVTDSINALYFGNSINNIIGTNTNFGEDAVAFAARFDLVEDERAFGTWAWLSGANSTTGGLVNVYVYDTTGFTFATGFPTNPIIVKTHTITQTDLNNGFLSFDFRDANGVPLFLKEGGYAVVYELFSNGGANPIFLGNNAVFPQNGSSSIFFITRAGLTPSWITGFVDSRAFVSPIIQLITCPDDATCMSISAEELKINAGINVFPNPNNGVVNIEFEMERALQIEATISSINGAKVFAEGFTAHSGQPKQLDITHLPAGMYILRLQSESGNVNTYKITKQ
ncbi:MAG: T9SS type A sorting domain-containing protein [Schleiferiaceae bacterium]|nr:T9SS type A sorting domain-containing protein [Schleiferiaceae bacterium]